MENNKNEFHLPYGEVLRSILVRPELTENNLKSFLKSKGVFLSKYSKEDTIPVLMRMLLSPNEYEILQEMMDFRIEKEKYRTTQIPWQGDKDIFSVMPNIDLHALIDEKYRYNPGFELIGVPSFMPVDQRKDKVILEFEVEENSDIATINNRVKQYKGNLVIELKEDGHLHLHSTKTFTSKSTQEIVNVLESHLEKYFKGEGLIKKEDSYERIMFNHFSNANRFLFFTKFTDDIEFLKFEKIIDVSVSPDPDQEIPESGKNFLKNIENLNLKGKVLQRHILFKEEFRESILLHSITIEYKFNHSEGKGVCHVEYAFPDFKIDKKDKAEFQFFIGKITVDRNYRSLAKKSVIEKAVFRVIDELKIANYNLLKIKDQ